MYKTKYTVITAIILLFVFACVYVALGKGTAAKELRSGIKQSLGQIFLVKKDGETKEASSNVTVEGLYSPATGEKCFETFAGEPVMTVNAVKFAGVYAVSDGIIEDAGETRISLRHSDGKKSVYTGVRATVQKGDSVKKGDSIGYAEGKISYRLYSSCIAVDPQQYFN